MSNLYDLNILGCTCDTIIDTKGCNIKKLSKSLKIIFKFGFKVETYLNEIGITCNQ